MKHTNREIDSSTFKTFTLCIHKRGAVSRAGIVAREEKNFFSLVEGGGGGIRR